MNAVSRAPSPNSRRRRRGFEAERELARLLWSKGFAVVRGPASGARARRLFYPDLIALYKGKIIVIEAKYRADLKQALYIERDKADKLLDFAHRAGGEAVIAVKIPRRGWYIIPFTAAQRTDSGALRIDEKTLNNSFRLEDYINMLTSEALTSFGAGRRVQKRPSDG